jgi:hypothetical protein
MHELEIDNAVEMLRKLIELSFLPENLGHSSQRNACERLIKVAMEDGLTIFAKRSFTHKAGVFHLDNEMKNALKWAWMEFGIFLELTHEGDEFKSFTTHGMQLLYAGGFLGSL